MSAESVNALPQDTAEETVILIRRIMGVVADAACPQGDPESADLRRSNIAFNALVFSLCATACLMKVPFASVLGRLARLHPTIARDVFAAMEEPQAEVDLEMNPRGPL